MDFSTVGEFTAFYAIIKLAEVIGVMARNRNGKKGGNPGNSTSAVALAKINVRLEGIAEDLGKLVDSVRDVDTGIKEIDRFIKA